MGLRLVHQNDLHDIADASQQLTHTTLYAIVYRMKKRIDVYSMPRGGMASSEQAVLTGSVITHPNNVYKVLDAFSFFFEGENNTPEAIKRLEAITA